MTTAEPDDILLAGAEAIRDRLSPRDRATIDSCRAKIARGEPLNDGERSRLAVVTVRAEFCRPRGSHTRARPAHESAQRSEAPENEMRDGRARKLLLDAILIKEPNNMVARGILHYCRIQRCYPTPNQGQKIRFQATRLGLSPTA